MLDSSKSKGYSSIKKMSRFRNFLRGVDLDIRTLGKIFCQHLALRMPTKILRTYGLKARLEVLVTPDRTVGHRHPFSPDHAQNEGKGREISLEFEGVT